MSELDRLIELKRQADEISYQGMNRDYENDAERLKHSIDYLSRALGMFVDLEIQKLEGGIVTYEPLKYVESKLGAAYNYVMNSTKAGICLPKPKEYTR